MICGISLRALVRPVGNVSGRGAGRAPTPSLSVTSEAMHVSLARVAARGTGCGTRDATGPLPEMAQPGAAVVLPDEGRPLWHWTVGYVIVRPCARSATSRHMALTCGTVLQALGSQAAA